MHSLFPVRAREPGLSDCDARASDDREDPHDVGTDSRVHGASAGDLSIRTAGDEPRRMRAPYQPSGGAGEVEGHRRCRRRGGPTADTRASRSRAPWRYSPADDSFVAPIAESPTGVSFGCRSPIAHRPARTHPASAGMSRAQNAGQARGHGPVSHESRRIDARGARWSRARPAQLGTSARRRHDDAEPLMHVNAPHGRDLEAAC